MKQLIQDYVFDPAAGTLTFTGPSAPASQEQLLLVTNTTSGTILYNFADPALGGSLGGNVLTLEIDTSAMSGSDKIQIYADIPGAAGFIDLLVMLKQLLVATLYPPHLDRSLNRLRGTVTVESGTVTTVTTVTNLNVFDTYQARLPVLNTSLNAWANSVRRTIS